MSVARVYCGGVWFRFVRSALLLAVVTCVVLLFGAMPGLFCFLHVTRAISIHIKIDISTAKPASQDLA